MSGRRHTLRPVESRFVVSFAAMIRELTAIFQPVPEGGFIAFVEELPGANTQGETLDEARENLREAVELILELTRESP